ncbi:MAG TPA: NIL domain-containing protein [Planctomycetota bacterium]|jgi:ABC-type methionine transport system ATPase subunit|nr:NIL domain-containing protein [Planctomycetota bacterium]
MAKEARQSLKLKLTFPEKVLGDPIIHTISHDFDVVPNILRGRITDKNAWLEVEMIGAPKNLERARKFLVERGVAISPLA